MTPTDPVEALARTVAVEAHAGQVDKAGEPYIGHCERVVARLTDPLDRAVAWLHDVVEDTEWARQDLLRVGRDKFGLRDSRALGEWQEVVRDVGLLTHIPHCSRRLYYEDIRMNSARAVRVKLADIADNSDPERLALLDDATRDRLTVKYQRAREALGEE